ncbi:hypothetical protein IAG41_11310 [Sphingomonas sp. JC676]|uniref:hypothetical protein n=1 Tax=Sphingomonas sp. JC676 TaxID=2768065 RepID=UPI001657849F|nr:hypothetical protein [Sphingomonas sp. JC676]MBC9032983.1 hypothetical protein [Sphingomonas sp. JC676]
MSDPFGVAVPALRAAASVMMDLGSRPSEVPQVNAWLQQFGWGTSHSIGDAADNGIRGWGAAGGLELAAGRRDAIGVSAGFFRSDDSTAGPAREKVRLLEGAVHWRRNWGSVSSVLRLAAGTLTSKDDVEDPGAAGTRKSVLLSASGGVQREVAIGRRLRLTPALVADYYRLAGGKARGSASRRDQSAVTGTIAFGYELGSMAPDVAWLRVDLEGGRREIVFDHFGENNALAAQRGGGLLRLRLSGGREAFSLAGEASAEERREGTGIALRLGSRLSW